VSFIDHLITAMDKTLYEQDYYLWLEKTISLLENRQFSELDLENLIEEIKDMSRRERQKLESLLTKLLEHLLKLTYWQSKRDYNKNKWRREILNFRIQIKRIISNKKDGNYNTNLVSYLTEILDKCYEDACHLFVEGSGIDKRLLSATPIGSINQILDENWFP
jgi:mRNA-degrading endonuclease RelE of RelBE toxin-antitoxin system